MRESFNYIEYSDQTKFVRTSTGRIELKEYSDNLSLYSSFDSTLDATYAISDITAATSGDPVIQNFGEFGQFVDFSNGGVVKYSENNISDMSDCCLKFRVKPLFTKGYGRQDFIATTDPTIAGDTYYKCRIYVNSTLVNGDDTSILLHVGDTMNEIENVLYAEINGKGATTELLVAGNIRVKSEVYGDSILISAPISGNSLITLLSGVDDPEMPNPPDSDADFFQIYNENGDSNRIIIIHDTESHIILTMFDNNGDTQVSADLGLWEIYQNTWYAFELNWNDTIYQLYLDGTLFGTGQTGFTLEEGGKIILQGDTTNPYGIDELIFYEEYGNVSNYTIETIALQKYADNDPYIDVYFGTGFSDAGVLDLNLVCSNGCTFVVKIANTWYYYLSGSWRHSDGTFSQSVSPAIMETKFSDLSFIEVAELIIRIYFHSDGTTLQYIDDINIVMAVGDSEPAIITGTVDLSSNVDLSTNYNIKITTNLGGDTVSCRVDCGDTTNVSLNEIKAAIDTASVVGLALAADDGNGHLVLQTTTVGESATISVDNADTNDALSIIWGYEATDTGEVATGEIIDYSELYRWIRAKLGEPTILVELTDEQIDDCIVQSVYWYNYYRNPDENVQIATLSGDNTAGYAIPSTIDPDLIVDIILRPRFPYTHYTQSTDILANLYVQYIFQRYKGGVTSFLADYYVTMSFQQDVANILGTNVHWEVRGSGSKRKLFIYPEPVDLQIGIRYKSAITLAEIITENWIRRFTLAESKLVLGNIRSTFKSGIPGGSEIMQLNGEDLIAQGTQEKEQLLAEIVLRQEPLSFSWG